MPPEPLPASSSSSANNTGALLRSLEDLRDSLSARVEQLSNAVERLRGQARELERALAEDGGLAGVDAILNEVRMFSTHDTNLHKSLAARTRTYCPFTPAINQSRRPRTMATCPTISITGKSSGTIPHLPISNRFRSIGLTKTHNRR